MRARLAVLISGRGSNMEVILREAQSGMLADRAEVVVVVSNRADAPGLDIARSFGVETAVVESRGKPRRRFDEELLRCLAPFEPDYLVLAGFMRVLTDRVIEPYRDRIVNIHPADTRRYRGAHGYQWALERGLESTTITIHFVDEGVDTGAILAQQEVDLRGARDLAEVERRGLAVEHRLYPRVLRDLLEPYREAPMESSGRGAAAEGGR